MMRHKDKISKKLLITKLPWNLEVEDGRVDELLDLLNGQDEQYYLLIEGNSNLGCGHCALRNKEGLKENWIIFLYRLCRVTHITKDETVKTTYNF